MSQYPYAIDNQLTLPLASAEGDSNGGNITVPPITSNYAVASTDFMIVVGAITSPITVSLPASPNIGDTYVVKDSTGTAAIYNIYVSGNGHNIDGFPFYTMANNYETVELTYIGTSWSIR